MNRVRQFWRHPLARVGSVAALATVLLGSLAVVVFHPAATAQAASSCHLSSARGDIQHVIYIQFDNTHFQRDNPNVPSDLEQMPHLLNFITNNGTLMTNDHTVLISHTATGILTSLTGVYPDRMGQPVSNSFRYFTPAGTITHRRLVRVLDGAALRSGGLGRPIRRRQMINENGKIAPAPWVPYTRAGCDVGSVATANTILENTAIDIPTVFGAGSPEAAEVAVESRRRPSRTSSASASTARRAPHSARRQPWPARPAARRAGRLHRLQRPVRREVRQPADQSERPDDRPQRQRHPGRHRACRLPWLRRHGGDGLALLGRADAGGRHPDHLRLHLGRARRTRHGGQHPLRLRTRRGRATCSS